MSKSNEPSKTSGWWCAHCQCAVPPGAVTYHETHDPREGGCGYPVAAPPKPMTAPAGAPSEWAQTQAERIVSRYRAVGEVRGTVDDALKGAIEDALDAARAEGPSYKPPGFLVDLDNPDPMYPVLGTDAARLKEPKRTDEKSETDLALERTRDGYSEG